VTYLDTNVLLSHYFVEDPNHPHAARLMETLRRRGEEMRVSLLTLVELYAYISRRIGALKPPPHYARLGQKKKQPP
jgi:predicted nucleic acid-binding protein